MGGTTQARGWGTRTRVAGEWGTHTRRAGGWGTHMPARMARGSWGTHTKTARGRRDTHTKPIWCVSGFLHKNCLLMCLCFRINKSPRVAAGGRRGTARRRQDTHRTRGPWGWGTHKKYVLIFINCLNSIEMLTRFPWCCLDVRSGRLQVGQPG